VIDYLRMSLVTGYSAKF